MSLLNDLKHAIEKGASDIAAVSEDIDGAVDRAVSIAKDGYGDVEREVDKILSAGELSIMDALKQDAVGKYGTNIRKVLEFLRKEDLNTLVGDLQKLQASITGKHLSQDAVDTLKGLILSDVVKKAITLTKDQFKTVSLAGGGNATFMAGLEGCYGGAISFDSKEVRALVGVGGLAGASEGIEGSLQLGFWAHAPKDLKGGYVAVEVDLGVEAGLGMQLVWEMPSGEYLGFVVAAFGGEEVAANLAAGYTFTFR